MTKDKYSLKDKKLRQSSRREGGPENGFLILGRLVRIQFGTP
jgi:hypothetical protein